MNTKKYEKQEHDYNKETDSLVDKVEPLRVQNEELRNEFDYQAKIRDKIGILKL